MDNIKGKEELFDLLEKKFYNYIGNIGSRYYIRPFELMYNNNRHFVKSSIGNDIVSYFIDNNCKETDYSLIDSISDKFKDYLYSLGINIPDYTCKNSKILIKHVVSEFVLLEGINLPEYTYEYEKLYGVPVGKASAEGIDIVNRFIFESERPWKMESDYIYEFREFYGRLNEEYVYNNTPTNMDKSEFWPLVYKYYKRDVLNKPQYTLDLYMSMWRVQYGRKWNSRLIEQEIDNITNIEVIKDYFIKEYYRPWKKEYNYMHEWQDYIRSLSVD